MALDRRHVLWVASLQVSAVVFENKSYEGLMHRRTILFLDRSRLRLLPGDLLGPVTIQRVQA